MNASVVLRPIYTGLQIEMYKRKTPNPSDDRKKTSAA